MLAFLDELQDRWIPSQQGTRFWIPDASTNGFLRHFRKCISIQDVNQSVEEAAKFNRYQDVLKLECWAERLQS